MSAEFRSTRDLTSTLIRVAHKISDENGLEEEAELILEATRGIIGRSLFGSVPDDFVLGDADRLLREYFKAKYAVIGAMALGIHGQVRPTEDIDMLVDPFPGNDLTNNKEEMPKYGFYAGKSSTGTVIGLGHRKSGYIELLAANDPLRQYAVETAKKHNLIGYNVPVVEADSLVALKVHAMTQNPNREMKDSSDVMSVLVRSKPSMKKVRKFLTEQENSRLDQLMAAANLPTDH